MRGRADRGQSQVVGNLLLVGVAVVLLASLAFFSFGFLDALGGPTAETKVSFQQTDAGVVVVPDVIGQEVTVQINGQAVATLSPDDIGEGTYLPTAPGDRVTLVASEDDRSILLDQTIDRGEAGDFIAYYTFDGGDADTLVDRSRNGNDGTINGNPQPVTEGARSGLRFDGSSDWVEIPDITTQGVSDVPAFTVATSVRIEDWSGGVQQFVEHYRSNDNEWFLEASDAGGEPQVDFAVNYPDDQVNSGTIETGERYVVVGTYDGSTYRLYIDGQQVASGQYPQDVAMGTLVVGADAPNGGSQYLDGTMYELRLYYTAFTNDEVETLTTRMAG